MIIASMVARRESGPGRTQSPQPQPPVAFGAWRRGNASHDQPRQSFRGLVALKKPRDEHQHDAGAAGTQTDPKCLLPHLPIFAIADIGKDAKMAQDRNAEKKHGDQPGQATKHPHR